MRTAELALLLLPLIVVVAWAMGVRGLSRRGIAAAFVLLACIAGTLFWLRLDHGFTGRYVPARLDEGQVLPGHPA